MSHLAAFVLLLLTLSPVCADEPSANLLLDVSSATIKGAIERLVDRQEPVLETILDTPVYGTSHLLGTVRAELLPEAQRAVVEVILRGKVVGQSVAVRPCSALHAASTAALEIRTRVVVDGQGCRQYPGTPRVQLHSRLLGVTNRRGETDTPVTTLACVGFGLTKHDAQEESARKMGWRVARRLHEEIAPVVGTINRSVGRELQRWHQLGLTRELLEFHTTAETFQMRVRLKTATTSWPAAPALPAHGAFGLRVQQSLLNELARAAYARRTIPFHELSKVYDEATRHWLRDGRPAHEQQIGLKGLEKLFAVLSSEPIVVTLAPQDPLTVDFSEQGLTVMIHVASLRQGQMHYEGMRVRARYTLENSGGGLRLVRPEPVRFLPAAEPTPSVKLVAQPPSFLLARELVFAEIFKTHLVPAPFPLPEALAQPRYLPTHALTRDGWLALVVSMASERPIGTSTSASVSRSTSSSSRFNGL